MTYRPKWRFTKLDICQQATLLFQSFYKNHCKDKLLKCVVSLFLHIRMLMYFLGTYLDKIHGQSPMCYSPCHCWHLQECTHCHMFPIHADLSATCSHLPVRRFTRRASHMLGFMVSSQIKPVGQLQEYDPALLIWHLAKPDASQQRINPRLLCCWET